MDTPGRAVLFELGNTIALVKQGSAFPGGVEIIPYRRTIPTLRALRENRVRTGAVVATDLPEAAVADALARAGLSEFLDPKLIDTVPDSARLSEAVALTRNLPGTGDPSPGVFVGIDARERVAMRGHNYLTAPHPALAAVVLNEAGPLWYVRIHRPPGHKAGWLQELDALPLAPLHVSGGVGGRPEMLYAIAGAATIAELERGELTVDRLGNAGQPDHTDVHLVVGLEQHGRAAKQRGTGGERSGRAPQGSLDLTDEGLIVAVPAGESLDGLFGQHVDALRLLPSWSLLEDRRELAGGGGATSFSVRSWSLPGRNALGGLAAFTNHICPDRMDDEVALYAGQREVSPGRWIRSRNVDHDDNLLAVATLIGALEELDPPLQVDRQRVRPNVWNVTATLAARDLAGRVIVSAHLDSFVDKPGHSSQQGKAPGADDDASGVAAVLGAARAIRELSLTGVPHREIRFVLFNAEEYSREGSIFYVKNLTEAEKKDTVVCQLDMIGHDGDAIPIFEIHAGYSEEKEPTIQTLSADLGNLVADATRLFVRPFPLHPRVHLSTEKLKDPAEGRSDHASFLIRGIPACLVCEHFFGSPEAPGKEIDDNKAYHGLDDRKIHAKYAADIARAVAAAAWIAATR